MNKCIYTGKETPQASFDSAEHIFPKCIGGQNCLPRGYVSDETKETLIKFALSKRFEIWYNNTIKAMVVQDNEARNIYRH